MFKRAKVVMLPTNEKASLCISQDKLTWFHGIKPDNEILVYRHLYIVSDDEIKESDLFISIKNIDLKILKAEIDFKPISNNRSKKIIATTDTTIKIKSEQAGDNTWFNPYPKPSDSFISKYIEEYNKGNVITDIIVEYEQVREYSDELDIHGHNVKVVKVNSKDNTITIKKIKDSWNREEVINLIKEIVKSRECKAAFMCYTPTITDVDKWLNDNL